MSSPSHKTTFADRVGSFSAVLLFFVVVMVVATQPAVTATPPQGTPRKIVSDDFTKNRQEAVPTTSNSKGAQGQASNGIQSKPRPPRRTYRLASSPVTRTRPTTKVATVAQLGITIWRLRPVGANDSGARMLVREKRKSSEWVPERVETDTVFREGDHVRLSIESPRPGYLYVVDRDLFSDGTMGGPDDSKGSLYGLLSRIFCTVSEYTSERWATGLTGFVFAPLPKRDCRLVMIRYAPSANAATRTRRPATMGHRLL